MTDRSETEGKRTYDESNQGAEASTAKKLLPVPLTFEEAFMEVARVFAKRSKDPRKKVGAVIHDEDGQIVAYGYNGMPYGIEDTDEIWEKEAKKNVVCHAELNALLHRPGVSAKGCTMYTTLFPCKYCTIAIIQARIKELIYDDAKTEDEHGVDLERSKEMFEKNNIKVHFYPDYLKLKARNPEQSNKRLKTEI